VAGSGEVLLQQQLSGSEGVQGFALGGFESFAEAGWIRDDTHTFSSSTGGRFEEDGIAQLVGGLLQGLRRSFRLIVAWNRWNPVTRHEGARLRLRTHSGDRFGVRPHEAQRR